MKTVRKTDLEVSTLGRDYFLKCMTANRRVRSLGLLLCLLLSATIIPQVCQGQSPLPPGPLDIHPLPGETATVRAGGPDGFFVSRETLRCDRPEEAIVGFRIRRGTVLDYLQIVCARIECVNGKCGWSSYLSTRSVGDPNGGQFPALLLCRRDEALSGYRARVMRFDVGKLRLDYVEDIAIECAKIAGPPGAQNVVPMLPQGRYWRTATGHLEQPQFEGVCPSTGATAVAAFGGRWLRTGGTVAQAMALVCGQKHGPCPAGTHSDFRDVLGSGGCKLCVPLHGSTNPVTGRTDREVANLPTPRYNCHFYTLSHLNFVTPPMNRGRVPRRHDRLPGVEFETSAECLEDRDFANYRLLKVQAGTINPAQLQVGDIVTVHKTSVIAQGCRNAHSAMVIQSGGSVVLRQKPNPVNCVTDFTWEEFRTFYQVGRGNGVNAWRATGTPGKLP